MPPPSNFFGLKTLTLGLQRVYYLSGVDHRSNQYLVWCLKDQKLLFSELQCGSYALWLDQIQHREHLIEVS